MKIIRRQLPITGGTLTGPLLLTGGTAAAPGLAFASESNTGIRWPSSNIIALVYSGTQTYQLRNTGILFEQDAAANFLDSSANEYLKLVKAADALNELSIANAGTGARVLLTATGEANAGMQLLGSGTGGVLLEDADGRIGFFATTPIAKLTGVAVTAGGIHAALVSYGLIAA